ICGTKREELIKRQAQAEDIASGIRLPRQALRSDVAQRADQVSCVREIFGAVGLCQPKVRHPDDAAVIEQQVRWLDITMKHSLAMGIAQGFRNLQAKSRHTPAV